MQLKTTLIPFGVLAVAAAGCGGGSYDQQSNTGALAKKPQPAGQPQVKSATEATGPQIATTLAEWKVGASAPQAKAGKVTFAAQNTGKAPHELVVIKTDKPADQLGSGTRVSEKGNIGETGDVAPGQRKTVSIKLKPGHYALICNLPGHYKLGMHTDLTVR
jgi:uncharacterized cupredoxin-like copper-binding protein